MPDMLINNAQIEAQLNTFSYQDSMPAERPIDQSHSNTKHALRPSGHSCLQVASDLLILEYIHGISFIVVKIFMLLKTST